MRRDMNFFNEFTVKKKSVQDGNSILVKTLVVIIAIFIVGTGVSNGIKYIYLASNISSTEKKYNDSKFQEQLKESNQVNEKLAALNEYDVAITEIVNAVASRDVVSTILMNQISSTLPTEIELTSINVDHSSIIINGTSKNRTAIAEMENNLKAIERIQGVQVSSIAGDTVLTFDIKCMLKDVE